LQLQQQDLIQNQLVTQVQEQLCLLQAVEDLVWNTQVAVELEV
jgi:hypothetical protein